MGTIQLIHELSSVPQVQLYFNTNVGHNKHTDTGSSVFGLIPGTILFLLVTPELPK